MSMDFLRQLYIMNILMFQIFGSSNAIVIKKRRLCVDVEVDNYRSDDRILSTHTIPTKHMCMVRCMRDANCHAFHFLYQDSLCELLPFPSRCRAQNTSDGTLYIELNICGVYPPRKAFLLPVGTWQWVSNVTDLTDAVPMVSVDRTRYVSRMFERGVYLPGWWTGDRCGFRAVRPYSNSRCCMERPGELLVFPGGGFRWLPFTAGNPVPPNALMGGYWMDVSPLYVIKITAGIYMCAGYYSVSVGQAFVDCNGYYNPVTMDILVHT